MSTTAERLDNLLTWPPNWNSYNVPAIKPECVAFAKEWMAAFRQECGESWVEPSVITGDSEGNVFIAWYCGIRSIDLYIEVGNTEGLKIYDRTVNAQMDDITANTPEERAELWKWLKGETSNGRTVT